MFVLPFTPPVPAGDEVLWLVDGQRILHGQVLYRDFDEVTFPGVQYFYAAVERLFGPHAWIPAVVYLFLGVLTAGLIFAIARRVLPGRLPALAVALYLVGPFFLTPDATHHWFAALFIYAGLWLALDDANPRRFALVGLCCALAAFFMQVKGVFALVAFASYLLWRGGRTRIWRSVAQHMVELCLSFGGALAALVAFAIYQAGFHNFVYDTVGFVLAEWRNMPPDTWRVYMAFAPAHSSLLDIPGVIAYLLVYGAVPLVYFLFACRYVRERHLQPDEPWDALVLIWLAGVALFLAVLKAPSTIRLASGSAPAFILLVWLLHAPGRVERIMLRTVWIVVLILAIACPLSRQLRWHSLVPTRVGTVAFTDRPWRDTISALLPLQPSGETCFGNHVACYLAGDVVVTPVNFIFPDGYTSPEQVRRIIHDLDSRRVPALVLRASFYLPADPAAGDSLRPFRRYVDAHYRLKRMFPNNDELWVRLPEAP